MGQRKEGKNKGREETRKELLRGLETKALYVMEFAIPSNPHSSLTLTISLFLFPQPYSLPIPKVRVIKPTYPQTPRHVKSLCG